MRISYIKKRYRILFISLIVIVVLTSLSFVFANKVLNIVVNEIAAGISVPSEIGLSVRRFTFSFKDGIVLKDLIISKGSEYISIPKVAFKKKNGSMVIKIDNASLDIGLIGSLAVLSPGAAGSKSGAFKIKISNVDIFYQDKTVNISKGFVFWNNNGFHWDLGLNCYGLSFDAKGFRPFKEEFCFFDLKSKFIEAGIAGKYDFNKGELESLVNFKDNIYDLGVKMAQDKGVFCIESISLGSLLIYNPKTVKTERELGFDWTVEDSALDAAGICSFRNEEERIHLYIKVLNSKFASHELITNLYIDYVLDQKKLLFKSVGSVFNKMPFPELSFSIALSDSGIVLKDFDYEGGAVFSGYFDYNMNYGVKGRFDNFDLHHMMTITMPLYARYLSVSRIDGNFSYFSHDGAGFTDIILKLQKGIIMDITFDSGKIHLIGNSNILEFLNSELVVDGMPLRFEGNVDISQFPAADMWKEVFLTPVSSSHPFGRSFFEDRFGDKKMSLGAKLKDNVRLDYNVEFSADQNYNKNEISLEITGSPYLKLRLKEGEEIMGVERKIKF
jgi:hypothetical protein